MMRCRLLGVLDLQRDGEALTGVLAQPRRLALIAYLAVAARGTYVRRDVLLSLFWPELDTEHGRAALRQLLHGLRTTLGVGVIVCRGQEEVGLDPAALTCDVWEFSDALAAGELERAAHAYGGRFLAGFFAGDAPGFDRWADDERESLGRRYVAALETLGAAAAARSDPRAAVNWWNLLLQADPYNTPAVIELMKALAAAGDRPNAVVAADRHAQRLRQELGVTPSRAFRELHDALRLPSGPGAVPSPVAATVPRGAAPPARVHTRSSGAEAPKRIGRYRILRVLGEGGMGRVYEAEQIEPVWRRVALKVIRGELDTRDVVARFEAERQALAVMDHPGIAKVLDAGATEEGSPYFVMEFVAGVPLTAYCDERRLTTRERLALFGEVCGAIQHAHQKGVIHRDLKPSNVLVSERDGVASPRVIDFGIAKAQGLRLTEKTLATDYGAVVGTPAYMSPEQAEGTRLDVDTRTDIYALGVMLYELLVGRLPVDPAEMGLMPFIAQLALRETNPPTPSERVRRLNGDGAVIAAQRRTEVARLAKELRGDLDWIVMKALAPERERRYATAAGLAADLERHLHDEPVVARPPSAWYRARKFAKRNTVGVIAGAVALLALVGGAVGSTVGLVRAQRAAQTATRVSAFLASLLEFGDPGRMRGGNPTARDILDDGAARLATELADEPVTQARLNFIMGRANYYLGRRPTADTLLQRSIALSEQHLGPDHIDAARGLQFLSYLRIRTDGESLATRALAIYERQSEPIRSGGIASALIAANGFRLERGEVERSERELARALAILEAYPDQERRRQELIDFSPRERTLHGLAQLAYTQGNAFRFDAARETWLRHVAVTERALGPMHPDVAVGLEGLASASQYLGQYAEAEAYARRAVTVRAQAEGDRGPAVLRYLGVLGQVLLASGQYAEADSVLTIVAQGTRPDAAATATVYRGRVALALGRPNEAQLLFGRVIAGNRLRTRSDSLYVAWITMHLGEALYAQRRYREAEDALRRAASAYTGHDSINWYRGQALSHLATTLAAQGRREEAESEFRRALALEERNYAATPAIAPRRDNLLRTLDGYAGFLRAGRRLDEARQFEDRAAVIRAGIPR